MAEIKDLAVALSKAQGANDRFAESVLVPALVNAASPQHRENKATEETLLQRFFNRIAWGSSDCWYWRGARNADGYGTYRSMSAHRISWELHNGQIPQGMQVLHRCDVRNCVNPEHLWLGTHADNMRDMNAKGRYRLAPRVRGERHANSVLSETDVLAIRAAYASGRSNMHQLAKEYGVGAPTIFKIVKRRAWSHI